MTRKHFEALADFARTYDLAPFQFEMLADVVEDFNPKFDREKFIDRCNYEKGSK